MSFICRTFARRISRGLSARQLQLLDGFSFLNEVSLAKVFSQNKIIELEIGFGNGDNLLNMALRSPDVLFIGAEPYLNGVVSLIDKICSAKVSNILIWPDNVDLLLPHIPDNSFTNIYILFPDPWPKNRHKKRRLINTHRVELFKKKLQQRGMLKFSSDVNDYVSWVDSIFFEQGWHKYITSEEEFLPGYKATKYHRKAVKNSIDAVQFRSFFYISR
ncbi:tRNA (guanosine(46)-N7)-methyltransferase TrmB [Candidatus Sneabacter namystus]|uniref:tRNA (guanine-N(7)-)-methyltransferase n=1 Tax=Candidatus Sneabacter namystus TaxID=2601646 RepID=A0A5C0UJR4_9RICK|nr:tRNA (guanosine(46)-N7)-methyltransferase TrmB [Candidatus Sneabacter namystus]QEK39722.1 tRNA (guanosine(46)-N7)-methyltransferase TrmB [Candidatus Sneabacter namystus]